MKPLPAGIDSESILPGWQGVGDLLDQAIFVVDSCAYLHLYRLVGTARTELSTALQNVITRLWVPHQVMKEVLDNSRTMPEAILREAQQSVDDLTSCKSAAEMVVRRAIARTRPQDPDGRRHLNAIAETFRAAQKWLGTGGRTDDDPAEALQKEYHEVSELITALMTGRTGPEPSAEQLGHWIMDSKRRHVGGMPPTYSDRKHKEPQRHGDCLIWHEMLEFAMSHQDARVLVLVTRDVKGLGWVEYQGQKLVGAHSHLVAEMMAAAKTQFIVMGTDDLLAYTKNAAGKVIWQGDLAWEDAEEPGSLRPVPSFFP